MRRLHSRRKREHFRPFLVPGSAIFCMKTASARAIITQKMRKFTFLEAYKKKKIEDLLTILRDPCSQQVVTLPLRSKKKKAAAQNLCSCFFVGSFQQFLKSEQKLQTADLSGFWLRRSSLFPTLRKPHQLRMNEISSLRRSPGEALTLSKPLDFASTSLSFEIIWIVFLAG